MALQLGIVGLPNVGKSTLLNALTHAHAEASNYPFCTIDKNVGVATIDDPRLSRLAELLHPEETIPAAIRFVDIAGLVRGASKGEGLGNQFLGHIREVDALVHVVRCFEHERIVHVDGNDRPAARPRDRRDRIAARRPGHGRAASGEGPCPGEGKPEAGRGARSRCSTG